MPFPKDDAQWPPPSMQPIYSKMDEWAAWYSGEPSRLVEVYARVSANTQGAIPWYRFWHRAAAQRDGSQRSLLHVPVTSDLASVSANLVLGESPRFRIPSAHEDEELPAKPFKPPRVIDPTQPQDPFEEERLEQEAAKPIEKTPAENTERRLQEIINRTGMKSRLMEAAESSAAIGGVYIYPAFDPDFMSYPVMAIAQQDMAIPEFMWGYLVAVTFHNVIEKVSDGEVFRHLERHEVEGTGESRKAVVLSRLYKGTATNLGREVQLSAHPLTEKIKPRVELPFGELDVQYVPNIRPNRLWRATSIGVSDISGSETLLDSIDETFASWMRDVRLAKARIIVPRDYLRIDATNENAATFDIDQEIYTGLEMEPSMNADARAILANQFDIRYLEHRSTARELIERVVSNAGYSPATLGQATDSAGQARTGAALRVSEHKTVLTQRRKAAYWKPALEMLCRHMLLIDKEIFKGDVTVPEKELWPKVEMSDSIIDQPLELAQTALAMKSAESASIETRVRILHADWSDSEIASEVLRIQDEVAASAPPVVSSGKFGDPEKDPSSGAASFPVTSQAKGRGGGTPPTPPPFAKNSGG